MYSCYCYLELISSGDLIRIRLSLLSFEESSGAFLFRLFLRVELDSLLLELDVDEHGLGSSISLLFRLEVDGSSLELK